jgi:Ser-tRNA(Ala) deacylase AlaX
MNTFFRYLNAGGLETTATVLDVRPIGESEEDDRASVVLSETLLMHETPDRVADLGWIDGEPVVQVTRSRLGEVLHHFAAPADRFRAGQRVAVKLDLPRRDLQARLLCAGRLIESIGPEVFSDLEPVAADFRPHRAKVAFGAREYVPPAESIQPGLCREIERNVRLELAVKCERAGDAPFRRVQIGGFRPFSCSGVYPRTLKAVTGLMITKVAVVGGRLEVRYRVREVAA